LNRIKSKFYLLEYFSAPGAKRNGNDKKYFFKHVLPWLIVIGVFVYLFCRIDRGQFYYSLLQADIGYYIFWLAVFSVAGFLVDAQNLHSILFHFRHPVSYIEALIIKGLSYILMMVNYVAGIGAIVYYLHRDKNISFIRSTGLMMIYNMSSRNSLLMLSGIGVLIAPYSSTLLDNIFVMCVILLAVFIVWILVLKLLPDTGKIKKFKELQLVKVFHEASWKSYILITLGRMIYYSLFIALFYMGVHAFNMEMPLLHLAIYVPIIMLIMSLPVTPFGLGTSQAAMVLFFKGFGTEANILAFGVTYSTSLIIIRGMIGLLCLKLKRSREYTQNPCMK